MTMVRIHLYVQQMPLSVQELAAGVGEFKKSFFPGDQEFQSPLGQTIDAWGPHSKVAEESRRVLPDVPAVHRQPRIGEVGPALLGGGAPQRGPLNRLLGAHLRDDSQGIGAPQAPAELQTDHWQTKRLFFIVRQRHDEFVILIGVRKQSNFTHNDSYCQYLWYYKVTPRPNSFRSYYLPEVL